MEKKICDKCGDEIGKKDSYIQVEEREYKSIIVKGIVKKNKNKVNMLDICSDCAKEELREYAEETLKEKEVE